MPNIPNDPDGFKTAILSAYSQVLGESTDALNHAMDKLKKVQEYREAFPWLEEPAQIIADLQKEEV